MMTQVKLTQFEPGDAMKLLLFVMVCAMPALLILRVDVSGGTGAGKAAAWLPFLPDDAAKELAQRSILAIEAAATSGAKNADDQIEVDAAILAGYTLSVKNPKDDAFAKLRGAAFDAVAAARKNDRKKLADFSKAAQSASMAPADVKDWTKVLHATEPMMKMFLSKAKGGEGIHADLQYHPSLKNTNGIEALIGKLAAKKLSDDNLTRVEKELPYLGYRIAVVGAITHEFTPKKDVEKWRDFARDMRDASIALADSARKKNAEGILKAASALENTCVECHSVFKSN
jgi:hypothetical protein